MSLLDRHVLPTATTELAGRRRPKPADADIVVRGLELGDRDHVAAILEHLGWQSRVQRFLAPRPILSERDLSMITSVGGLNRGGAIAFAGAAPIGAAHYVRTADPEVAEIAIEVVDDWQGRGVGRLLIADLRTRALRAGCSRWEWFAFESNRAAAALAHDLSDIRRTRIGPGVAKWSAAIC
jgi:GNAT superfamily N-acetyltransferase